MTFADLKTLQLRIKSIWKYVGKLCKCFGCLIPAITCAIPNVNNGAITCQDNTVAAYNEQCSVSCNDGFTGNASSVTCGNGGDLEPISVCQG